MSLTPSLLAAISAAPTALRAVDTLVEEAGNRFADIFAETTTARPNTESVSSNANESWQKRLEDWIKRLDRAKDQAGFSGHSAEVELSREGNVSVEASNKEFEDFLLSFFENNPGLEDQLREIQQLRSEEQRLPNDHFISVEALRFKT